jgi:hypothetical protein
MELLGDVGHVEYCCGPIGDGVSSGGREVHCFAWNVPYAQKLFWTHPIVHLVEANFGLFGDSANLDAR